jgi:hypothetical protein
MLFNSSPVWNAGNDGAGSGMDADLLDGQQGNYYTDIPSRLGYSPDQSGGDTLTETIRYRNTDASPLASRSRSITTALQVCHHGRGWPRAHVVRASERLCWLPRH